MAIIPFIRRNLSRIFLILVIIIIFAPITLVQIYIHDNNDYGVHIENAEKLLSGFNQVSPMYQAHPLYQILTLVVHFLTRLDFRASAAFTSIGIEIFLGLVLFWIINSSLKKNNLDIHGWKIFLIICLLIVAPIPLLVFFDLHLYFGYLGMANYHNSTINLLKPFAFLNFVYALKAFELPKARVFEIALAAIFTILSTLTKPSLMICILPALAIYGGIKYLLKQRIDWFLLSFGFFIPAGMLLLWEYSLAFTPEVGIQFEPLAGMRMLSDHVTPKFLISILFPAGVTLFYFKKVMKDQRMVFAWLIFLFGAIYSYFLLEGGIRRADGNFIWSGEISMFILFCFSTIFYLEEKIKGGGFKIPDFLLISLFFLHVASGVIYYIYCINVNHMSYLPHGIITPLPYP